MDPRRRGVRFFGLQALFDTMASDDEEAAVPQPTVTKKIVSEIALKQQKKERHADGSGNVVEKVPAPFRALAIKPPDPSQVQPETKKNARESESAERSSLSQELSEQIMRPDLAAGGDFPVAGSTSRGRILRPK